MTERILTGRELNRALLDEGERLLRFIEPTAKAYEVRFKA